MDFSLTEEQQDFVAAIRDFCARECGTPEQRERLTDGYSSHHSAEIYAKMAELGWLGVLVPEAYGGSGGSMLDACLFMEETSRGLAPIGGFSTTMIVAGAAMRFGNERQKDEILGGIAAGAVEAIAMTEPEAGSDVGAISTTAEPVDGGFRLNGQKVFCSNAHLAEHVLVVARTTPGGSKHEGLSMIWVPADADGLESTPIETMGGRETNHLYFTDCFAAERDLLGRVDQGWTQLMAGLNVERLILAATMLGIAQRAFDDALAYVKERRQFGRPIGSFQALQHRLADLATELESARLMTYWVASLVDRDPDHMLPREASMVKLHVTEVAKRVTLEGMQMMGGYGYSSEYDMERLVRASLVSTIYGGTSEIQRTIIAKTLGLKRREPPADGRRRHRIESFGGGCQKSCSPDDSAGVKRKSSICFRCLPAWLTSMWVRKRREHASNTVWVRRDCCRPYRIVPPEGYIDLHKCGYVHMFSACNLTPHVVRTVIYPSAFATGLHVWHQGAGFGSRLKEECSPRCKPSRSNAR